MNMKADQKFVVTSIFRPSEYLVMDQGTAYTSKEMIDSLEAFGLRLGEAPIKTPVAVEAGEQHQAPLEMACKRI